MEPGELEKKHVLNDDADLPSATTTETPTLLTTATTVAKTGPIVTVLIPADSDHPGAGAVVVSGAFSSEFLERLQKLRVSLPADDRRPTCTRRFFKEWEVTDCDDADRLINARHTEDGWVTAEIQRVLARIFTPCSGNSVPMNAFAISASVALTPSEKSEGKARDEEVMIGSRWTTVLPWYRFLEYQTGSDGMAPHTDGGNPHPSTAVRSTATMLLYLSDCYDGGNTSLLRSIKKNQQTELCSVSPRLGQLLIFPHKCPHVGMPVGKHVKIALRAEVY